MFHMLSCFNLKPGEDIESFRSAYARFVDEMKTIDLVESSRCMKLKPGDDWLTQTLQAVGTFSAVTLAWRPLRVSAWARFIKR